MNSFMMRRRALLAAAGGGFPDEPTAYDELIGTYNSSTTFVAPEDGWFEVQLFGASGAGGSAGGVRNTYGSEGNYGTIILGGGGGGGGGGHSASRVKLHAGDTVVLTLGTGACTATINNTTKETYSQMTVTQGAAGGTGSGTGRALDISRGPYVPEDMRYWSEDTTVSGGVGGVGGKASGGNYKNTNGLNGNTGGTQKRSTTINDNSTNEAIGGAKVGGVYSAPGGEGGDAVVSGCRTGGEGQGETYTGVSVGLSNRQLKQTEVTAAGSAKAGFCRIYRGNTNLA